MTRGPAPRASALRWAAIGAVAAGAIGGIIGLILGLVAHPPTAWFAVFELGIPASMLGGIVGLASGAVVHVISRSDPEESHAGLESNPAP